MSKNSATRKTVRDRTRSGNDSARARLREQQLKQARDRKRRRLLGGIAAAVVLIVIAGGVVTFARRQATNVTASPTTATSAAAGRRIMPPWPLPSDPTVAAKQAGLQVGQMEGTAEHFHVHLDITVDGKPIAVPAELGIDTVKGQLSELHTHDDSGVLHIEAPTTGGTYTLGQAFVEWRIRLDSNGIGALDDTADKTLRAYVDGKRVSGDPAAIKLTAHEEIALIYGARNADDHPPSSYAFPAGL